MNDDALRVEFKVQLAGRRPAPKPAPGAKAERQRQDRAARRARNLALAYWIDELVRSGKVADLAAVARMCRVSRARVSNVVGMLGIPAAEQEKLVGSRAPLKKLAAPSKFALHSISSLPYRPTGVPSAAFGSPSWE